MTIPKEKLIYNKVSKTTISKLQQEIVPILKRDIQNFRGGNVKNHLTKWENYTSDKIILDIIENTLRLDSIDNSKSNSKIVSPLSHEEEFVVKKKVPLLIRKNMLLKTIHLYYGVFTRSKKDGSKLMILNNKRLNKFVGYEHFKME